MQAAAPRRHQPGATATAISQPREAARSPSSQYCWWKDPKPVDGQPPAFDMNQGKSARGRHVLRCKCVRPAAGIATRLIRTHPRLRRQRVLAAAPRQQGIRRHRPQCSSIRKSLTPRELLGRLVDQRAVDQKVAEGGLGHLARLVAVVHHLQRGGGIKQGNCLPPWCTTCDQGTQPGRLGASQFAPSKRG